jgi:divalent metal cation (Fe/Co/Zn/Cd) transporter
MAVEMKSLLMGEAASEEVRAEIRAGLLEHPQVVQIIHMRTQHLGPEELLVAAKIEFTDGMSVVELAGVIDSVEEHLRARVAIARVIYIEPDVHRAALPA